MKKRFAVLLMVALLSFSAMFTVAVSAANYGDNDFSITFFPSGNLPENSVPVEIGDIVYIIQPNLNNAIVFDGHKITGDAEIAETVIFNGKSYTVRAIAESAFANSAISTVTIPSSIALIGDKAFANCINLTECDFSSAPAKIGNRAFIGCSSLENFYGNNNILYTGEKSLDDTQWFKSESDGSEIYFGKCLYRYSGSASNYTLRSDAASIAPHAFEYNTSLNTVSGNAIKQIGSAAFRGCSDLSSVNFLNSLEYIGNSAFDGCSISGSLILTSLKSVGASAFRNCEFSSVKISSLTVTRIPSSLFAGCANLEAIELSDNITAIGSAAFSGCSVLNSVNAPGILNIEYNAFRNCTALTDKTMFASVESISTGAFDNTAVYLSENGGISRIGNTLYKTERTAIEHLAVENGVKSISPLSFYNLESIASIALPTSLTNLDSTAFPKNALIGANVFVFADNSSLYSDLEQLTNGTIYIKEGKSINTAGASVGTIQGIRIESMPAKTEYKPNENFDPTGIKICLDTEIDGETESVDISTIGYAPEYSYNFSESSAVTVNYCGYSTTLNVTVQNSVPGDLDQNGKVNTDDILLIRKYIAGIINDEAIDIKAADINNSVNINTDDLLILRRIIAGLVVV